MTQQIVAITAPRGPGSVGKLFAVLDPVVNTVVAVALVSEVVAVLMGVVTRSVFGYGLLWTDEAAKIALAVIGFIGGAAAYIVTMKCHAVLQVVLDRLPPPQRRAAIIALTEWLVILVAVILVRVSLTLLVARSYEVMSVLQISGVWAALPLTIGMMLLLIYAGQRLSVSSTRAPDAADRRQRRTMLAAAVIFGKDFWLPWIDGDTALYIEAAAVPGHGR